MESLKTVVDGIAGTFGPRCEVVLHDLSTLDHSIIKIANGHVTGRTIGGSITDQGLRQLRSDDKKNLVLNYRSVRNDGRPLKNSTLIFRNDTGVPIAAICINFDVTDILAFNALVQDVFGVSEEPQGDDVSETFEGDVVSTLEKMAVKAIHGIGKPLPTISKEERLQIVRELDGQGFFLIKGAVKILAEKLKISKFTIYNYLDQVKNQVTVQMNQEKGR